MIGGAGLVPIEPDKNLLPLGQVVSYGDMANSRRKSVVVESEASSGFGQRVIAIDGSHESTVCQQTIDGPGGWHKEREVETAEEVLHIIGLRKVWLEELPAKQARDAANKAEIYEAEKVKVLAKYGKLLELQENSKKSCQALAAANIRKLLKQEYPGHKFSVTSSSFSMGNSVDIKWTDGPTTDEVRKIEWLFSEGSFNGMEDIYEYKPSVFTDMFGGSKYVHSQRDLSADVLNSMSLDLFTGDGGYGHVLETAGASIPQWIEEPCQWTKGMSVKYAGEMIHSDAFGSSRDAELFVRSKAWDKSYYTQA